MTGRIDQVVIAFTTDEGMRPVASSFVGEGVRRAWHDKLREHVRLLSQPDRTPPPAEAFSHLDFGDGTAAVLRRTTRPGDAGRNLAHALIGSSETIAGMARELIDWDGWQDVSPPIGVQLNVLRREDFHSTDRVSEVDREVLLSVLATVRAWEDRSFTVIGVPDELRLPVVWKIREILPDQVWTFSTYEQDDAPRRYLPRLVFLSEPPANFLGPESGRVRMNVANEISPNHHAYQQAEALLDGDRREIAPAPPPEQPTVVFERLPEPPPSQDPVEPPPVAAGEWQHLLYGNGSMLDSLNRLADLVRAGDIDELREPALAWIADPRVRQSHASFLAEYLSDTDSTAVDHALGRRVRAAERIPQQAAVAAPEPPARPEPDAGLVKEVWHRQLQWSARAGRAKTKVVVFRALGLIALIMGTLGAVLAARLAPVDQFWTIAVGVATAAVVSIGTWLRTWQEPREREEWTDARRGSEEIKSELCTYLVGAGRYRAPEADALLRKVLVAHQPVVGGTKHQDPPGINDLSSYVSKRVTDQIDYHAAKAHRFENGLEIAKVVEVGFGFVAALLALLAPLWGEDVAVWAAVCTAIAGIVAAHMTRIGYQRLCARYRKTVKELRRLRANLPEDPDLATRDAFVADCERVLVEQNDDWHAHLTPLAGKEQP